LFPKVPDYHKSNKPLIPNGFGVIYVLVSATYLFLLNYFADDVSWAARALTLAVCILFGGFMGLLDDWMDLKWRYKAFLPLVASVPLITLAKSLRLRTAITLPLLGSIQFGDYYYFLVIPLIVTITTNTINQLGGLNGLETICPAVVLTGLMSVSGRNATLLYVPLIVWLTLAFYNFRGKLFVGNSGSFAIGITIAAFAIISDVKSILIISILPYIFNSSLILLTFFLFKKKAKVRFDGKKLSSGHKRSLITLITYYRPMTERQTVLIIALLMAFSTFIALFAH